MKLIIAGSRGITDQEKVKKQFENFMGQIDEIVSGGCPNSPDMWAKNEAVKEGFKYTEFPADWQTHGKRAGFIRNEEMAEYGDILLAVWDGKSKGTRNMINSMLNRGKSVLVIVHKNV